MIFKKSFFQNILVRYCAHDVVHSDTFRTNRRFLCLGGAIIEFITFDTSLIGIGFFVIAVDLIALFFGQRIAKLPRSSNISWLFYAFYLEYNYFWTVNEI